MRKTLIFLPLMWLSALSVQARARYEPISKRPVSFVLGGGMTFGGETLINVHYTNGTTDAAKAGEQFYGKVGAEWQIAPAVALQGVGGYHSVNVNGANGNLTFKRLFVEAVGYYALATHHRIGLGVRQLIGAKLTINDRTSAPGLTVNVEYSASLAPLVAYEWFTKTGPRGGGLVVRYVFDRYKEKTASVNGQSLDFMTPRSFDGKHLDVGFVVYL